MSKQTELPRQILAARIEKLMSDHGKEKESLEVFEEENVAIPVFDDGAGHVTYEHITPVELVRRGNRVFLKYIHNTEDTLGVLEAEPLENIGAGVLEPVLMLLIARYSK